MPLSNYYNNFSVRKSWHELPEAHSNSPQRLQPGKKGPVIMKTAVE